MAKAKAKSTILVVDDEADILRLLSFNLEKAGFSVIKAADGPEALKLAAKKKPDLVLLDIMLPDMEGTEVLKRLKANAQTAAMPVLMLTAKGEEVDRILGFELGAEDYITKPFSPREVVLRVKAVLKRGQGGDEDTSESAKTLCFKELTIDEERHSVMVGKHKPVLTSTEFKLLKTLIGGRGRVFSRDTLLDRAWGTDTFVTPRTVDTHVRRLREKLKTAGKYIETIRGVGYRFTEEE
ncbi:MAG: response regulator transcription factor [Deltaproteobacteria bacterium]|nr:response regulator transcription factor [Deltaproteobacteria bacterium]